MLLKFAFPAQIDWNKSMRVFWGLLIFIVYFASIAQIDKGNTIKGFEKIVVMHSHTEPHAHEHENEHGEHGHSETTNHDHENQTTHTHVILIAASPLHASAGTVSFVAFEFINSSYPVSQPPAPPTAPGPGSIFRPPIV